MARIRNIKPDFFLDADLADLGPTHQLLFAGLWVLADCRGILEDRPRVIKAVVFPHYDADVDAMLDDLAKKGFIERYEADSRRCVFVVNFIKHQWVSKSEAPSDLPKPPETRKKRQQRKTDDSSSGLGAQQRKTDDSKTTLVTVCALRTSEEDTRRTQEEDTRRTQEEDTPPKPVAEVADSVGGARARRKFTEPDPPGFEAFWAAYPRKEHRGDARRWWAQHRPSADLVAAMVSALTWQCERPDWRKDRGRYVPHPASWLNAEGWTDEPPAELVAARAAEDAMLYGWECDYTGCPDERFHRTAKADVPPDRRCPHLPRLVAVAGGDS